MGMTKARGFDWATSALTLVMAAAAAFLIWSLAAENRELNAEVTNLYARLDSLQETTALQISYAEGDTIPDTPVVGPSGETAALAALVSRGGVLVFLTTTCPFCKEMLPIWTDLSEQYAARGVPFAGVVLEGAAATAQYVADQSVEFPMWALADPASAEVRVAIVPYTMLVNTGGVVQSVWSGVLEESETAMLAAALDRELLAANQTLSGSSGRDPVCCEALALGTDALGRQ
jgi:thiol-disulfide isomerase/thioredoxin